MGHGIAKNTFYQKQKLFWVYAVKEVATHCLPAFCLNVVVLPLLKSAHIVLLGTTTSYTVSAGFSSTIVEHIHCSTTFE